MDRILWYGLAIATILATLEPTFSLKCISCRCGLSNKNYTLCTEKETKEEYLCETWAQCQTCNDNTTNCITCPPKQFGPLCTKDAERPTRKKRQSDTDRSTHCENEGSIENGRVTVIRASTQPLHFEEEDFELPVGTRLLYSCEAGYVLQGPAVLVCESRGYWSDLKPECIEDSSTKCSDPGQISFGSFRNSDGESSSSQEYSVGEVVIYYCESGYNIVGSREVTCLPTGSWSSKPSCSRRPPTSLEPTGSTENCRDPGSISNGYRRLTSGVASRTRTFSHGQTLRYFCNEDYDLEGNNVLTCLTSGQWSSNTPRCFETNPTLNCPDPGSIENGFRRPVIDIPSLVVGRFNQGQSFRYFCDYGYELRGDSILTCLSSGRWSSNKPSCQNVIDLKRRKRQIQSHGSTHCLNEGPIAHGWAHVHRVLTVSLQHVDDFEFPVGTRLRYSCYKGYVLKGAADHICKDDGYWSEVKPTCVEIKCEVTGPVLHGRVFVYFTSRFQRQQTIEKENGLYYPVGTRTVYYCNKGFVLQGRKNLYCESNGKWSAKEPTCIKREASHMRRRRETPPYFSDIETYPPLTVCSSPAVNPNSGIEYIPDDDPRRSGQGFRVGSEVTFTCRNGYELDGTNQIVCSLNGQWTSDSPICREIAPALRSYGSKQCLNEGPIDNGRVAVISLTEPSRFVEDEYEFPLGTHLRYRCNKGYTLEGTADLVCVNTGYWTDIKPKCVEMKCKKLGPVLNGRVVVQFTSRTKRRKTIHEENGLTYPEGTSLRYECDYGYILEGNKTLICESTGKWSSNEPVCSKECGVNSVDSTRTEFPGTKTIPGEWPWTVAIAVKENSTTRFICSGVLLDTRTVLTVAQCVHKPRDYTVYFGLFRLNFANQSELLASLNSSRILVHPSFNPETLQNDIALITFEPPVVYTERVQPICLPSTRKLPRGEKGFLSGWETRTPPSPLQELSMIHIPVLSGKACKEIHRKKGVQLNNTRETFCAGLQENIEGFCSMAYGSPIVFYNPDKDSYTLEGLVSWQEDPHCKGRKKRYALTRIIAYLPWILTNWHT